VKDSRQSEKPIRVAFCHFTADVCGGSDRSLFDLVTHLDRDSFVPYMVLKKGDPLAPKYREAGCEVEELPFVPPRRALEWGKLLRFFAWFWPHVIRVAWLLRSARIDLVHVNTLNNLQGAFAATLARKPLVWHVRELVPASRVDTIMRGLVSRLATITVANSPAVAETLRGCGERVRTVLNGIDLSEYPEDGDFEPGRFNTEPLIVCVGRQEPWKGQHVLVEALPRLFAAHPTARVWFVGGGAVNKPEYAPGLVARCEALGIAEQVTFTGIRHDIPDVLREAAMLVLPSVTPEPFGRTLVEGMVAGCAVVATAAGGPLDIVIDGDSGILVPPDDAGALAESLIVLLNDPARAGALGRAGEERARTHFSLARVVDEMAEIFQDVYTVGSRQPQ
jgi:glycosyltransferase involved in cell wall biosynthesis